MVCIILCERIGLVSNTSVGPKNKFMTKQEIICQIKKILWNAEVSDNPKETFEKDLNLWILNLKEEINKGK